MAAFELKISKFLFAPNLIPLVTTFIVIPLLVSLGLWQLDRADEKRVIDGEIKKAVAKQPIDLNSSFNNTIDKLVYRKVLITGHYDSKNQLLLDNRTHSGKPGYHVLTPFNFEGKNKQQTILINRGWIGYQGTREKIPDIEIDETQKSITGSIKAISDAIVLSKNKQQEEPVKLTESNYTLIQSIQLKNLENTLGNKLLPVVIELDKTQSNGFIRNWKPYYGSVDKHNAYALQWFAMALVVLFLFMKLNIKKI